MTIRAAVYNLLADDAAIAALVSTRIYPTIVPQGATLPYVTFQLLGATFLRHMVSTANLYKRRFQIDCYDNDTVDVAALAEAVRTALENYSGTKSGTVIRNIFFESERDDLAGLIGGDETGPFRVSFDIEIWHQ